ncbi:beta-galactosidase [Burkholderia lata]|uniref:Beta-galactosidase n=1 Tax=Burkholderia lata (strain ATCC 17760 / DSM 23089 / LMG 22485 / NCIMB 9086 / R18194 / 383) TaxID=482957 RepID=A0A6P2SBE1_BURL3|nr:sugar-binding domain-containing protein [Burkholderia lata]VWC47468.1 beta-galactosidase [Burkholderia lata]
MTRVATLAAMTLLLAWQGAVLAASLPVARATDSAMSLSGMWRVLDANDAPVELWRPDLDDRDWRPLHVPANWYAAGLDHQGALWYRTTFPLDVGDGDRMTTLEFDGVDYEADVWLNGVYLGNHEGYFAPFAFDVTGAVRAGDNRLAVLVRSPYEPPGSQWSLHKRLVKGILNDHDTRPGGAWSVRGQDANSGGIWAPVNLRTSRGVAIDTLKIETVPMSGGTSGATIDVEVHARALRDARATLRVEITPANFSGRNYAFEQPVELVAGTNRLTLDKVLDEAAWWWPAEYGFPSLYTVSVALIDAHGTMDSARQRTGVRTFRFDRVHSCWTINGRRMFLRGTNYIGSPWLSEMDAARYARDLDLMRDAHINAIRVHAHVAGQPLYDAADEKGMLVWQDFPLQWGYDDSSGFARKAADQARDMVAMLDHHPAIVAWSGQNEPPWDAEWMKYRYPDWDPRQNRLLSAMVGAALREDPTRHADDASLTGQHFWLGWYWGKWTDVIPTMNEPNITEFGAQALPELATLRRIVSPSNLWPADTSERDPAWEDWAYHDFQRKETFEIAGVERGRDLAAFVANSQRYQARLVQRIAETLRRQRYQPVAAVFQFMFVEGWPSIDWGVVDYLRRPKAGYFALARAYQPVLPSIAWTRDAYAPGDTFDATLWAINDTWTAYPRAILEWKAVTGGKAVATGRTAIDMAADSGRPVTPVRVPQLVAGTYTLEASLVDATGHVLGTNQFDFDVRPAP